jgi:GNAT superfamily N-acetyltransferase/predicted nucleic acid-binding protein
MSSRQEYVVLKIQTIGEDCPLLKSVIRLGDKNSKFVGFFPEKAFIRSARDGLILCAVDDNRHLCGYLLYYVARQRAVIQQLCVTPNKRREGVASALVEHLIKITSHLDGVLLHCCRDFPSHAFWPEVGFVAESEKLGRGARQRVLTRYWYDHGHPTLFSSSGDQGKVVAVIDANVLFDLQDPDMTETESRGLLADWLNENVDLKITSEVLNEIDRHPDPHERKRRKAFARGFETIESSPEKEKALEILKELLPKRSKPSDRSDQRQVAMAMSGGAQFFLTRDTALHRHADDIFQRLGITVAHPAEFILRIDELLRRVDYHPVRLSGSNITTRRVGAADVGSLGDTFLSYSEGEKMSSFERRLRSALAKPAVSNGILVECLPEDRLGLIVICEEKEDVFTVRFFRVSKGSLAPTVARSMAMLLVKHTCSETGIPSMTLVVDPHLDRPVCAALSEIGFLNSGAAWVKLNAVGIEKPPAMAGRLRSFYTKYSDHRATFDAVANMVESCGYANVSHDFILNVERRIWPGKLEESGLADFIVPIQPRWAMHLFDEQLARQNLFGAATTTALACENVYYRAKDPRVLEAPGRILWYVSADEQYEGPGSIRACSALQEVVIGKAKEIFRRFERLGIYNWDHVSRSSAVEKLLGYFQKNMFVVNQSRAI